MISEVKNMDCIEYMQQFPDKFFELAIVDPPYGLKNLSNMNNLSKSRNNAKENFLWDIKPNKDYFKELFRVSKFQIIWGANNFILPTTEYFIIWNKKQTVENFASAEYAWTNVKKPAQIFDYSIHKTMADRKEEGGKIHPTQKPVALYRWLLQNYAKQGDKILDTHLGSGSSRIAADMEGFDFYACELDKDYFDASCKRFDEYKKQLKLL